MKTISLKRLREVLHYDPKTGQFTWLVSTSNRVRVGDVAGCGNSHGYRVISVDGTKFQANRLAVFWMTGVWPAGVVDHENRDRGDNTWDNLRPASVSENSANSTVHRDNHLGLKGVHIHQQTGRFRAQIMVRGEKRHLGLFDTPELAHSAYLAAARNSFGQFASGGE